MADIPKVQSVRTRIIVFFIVAYFLTWIGNLGNYFWPSEWWIAPMNPFGPIIAAPLVIWYFGGKAGLKEWGKRLLKFRANGKVWACSFFIPLAIIIVSVSLSIFFRLIPSISADQISMNLMELLTWTLPLVILFELIGGPLEEEPSFRGYGQHELQKTISPFAASLWIGLGVLIWHIPVFVLGMVPWPVIFALPAVSVVYAWLYVQGGSVYPLVLLHLTQNVFGSGFFGPLFSQAENTIWLGFLTIFYIIWAGLIYIRYGSSLKNKK